MSTDFVLIHDERFEPEARHLALPLCIKLRRLEQLDDGALRDIPEALIVIDLRNLATVATFRAKIGKAPPPGRSWAFFISSTEGLHAGQVQADALGATTHVHRANPRRQMRQLFSVAGQPHITPEKAATLARSPGGRSVAAAGAELAGLFDSLSLGEELKTEHLVAAGASVTKDIGLVGAEQWLATVRSHHEGTFQHCLLVAGVVGGYVARHVPGKANAERLMTAAMLHDIGKASVPLHVLDKQGKLTDGEFAAIRAHPGAAFDYLVKQGGMDRQVLDAVRHHHEALDGGGYPDRLAGDRITPLTRILTVCDVYAAMIEARAYKPPATPEEAISVLVKMALAGKVDYGVVRRLAMVFGMEPPETLAEVQANLGAGGAVIGRRPAAATA